MQEIFATCDYITLHIPLNADTKGTINAEAFASMKNGVRILNFARDGLVNSADMIAALASGKVASYVVDFPTDEMIGVEGVVCIPHLGASTPESEDNCAMMAAEELIDFIENGNITNSVNFPAVNLSGNFAKKALVLFDAEKVTSDELLKGVNALAVATGVKKGKGALLVGLDKDADFNQDGILKVYKF